MKQFFCYWTLRNEDIFRPCIFLSVAFSVPCSTVKHTDITERELCFVETKDETWH